MRKKRVIGAVVITLTFSITMIILLWPHSDTPPSSAKLGNVVATAQQPAPTLTTANVAMLQESLNSSDKAVQAKALAPQLRNGDWNAAALLPNGAALAIDQSSFTTDSNGYGRVNATVTGSVDAQFVMVLTFVDGQWLLASTIQK